MLTHNFETPPSIPKRDWDIPNLTANGTAIISIIPVANLAETNFQHSGKKTAIRQLLLLKTHNLFDIKANVIAHIQEVILDKRILAGMSRIFP